MKIKALTPDELPFNGPQAASCRAARVAEVRMEIPGIPGEFEVQFVGTGIATMPNTTKKVFDPNDNQKSVELSWYQNKFVGQHWFLGEFSVELAENKESTGTIEVVEEGTFGAKIINKNDFYFDFKFKRFPFLNMVNVEPIRNSAVISGVPPVGSIFRMDETIDDTIEFKSGSNRISLPQRATTRKIKFNQCDVTVFPERNVGLELVKKEKRDERSYEVTVRITNITETKATFTYFTVIHYAKVQISGDYGFVLLSPGENKEITYKVTSEIPSRKIDLPFFSALYKPTKLNGSKSLELDFEF